VIYGAEDGDQEQIVAKVKNLRGQQNAGISCSLRTSYVIEKDSTVHRGV
jgi:hypothetical protein